MVFGLLVNWKSIKLRPKCVAFVVIASNKITSDKTVNIFITFYSCAEKKLLGFRTVLTAVFCYELCSTKSQVRIKEAVRLFRRSCDLSFYEP